MSPPESISANERGYHTLERGYCCCVLAGGTAPVVTLQTISVKIYQVGSTSLNNGVFANDAHFENTKDKGLLIRGCSWHFDGQFHQQSRLLIHSISPQPLSVNSPVFFSLSIAAVAYDFFLKMQHDKMLCFWDVGFSQKAHRSVNSIFPNGYIFDF